MASHTMVSALQSETTSAAHMYAPIQTKKNWVGKTSESSVIRWYDTYVFYSNKHRPLRAVPFVKIDDINAIEMRY